MSITIEDVIRAAAEAQAELRNDRTLPAHLYADKGWRITRIARHMGLDRSTVYRRLVDSGAYTGPGKPGAPRKPTCQRGHDMAVHGREMTKKQGSGRRCSECKRQRERRTPS